MIDYHITYIFTKMTSVSKVEYMNDDDNDDLTPDIRSHFDHGDFEKSCEEIKNLFSKVQLLKHTHAKNKKFIDRITDMNENIMDQVSKANYEIATFKLQATKSYCKYIHDMLLKKEGLNASVSQLFDNKFYVVLNSNGLRLNISARIDDSGGKWIDVQDCDSSYFENHMAPHESCASFEELLGTFENVKNLKYVPDSDDE